MNADTAAVPDHALAQALLLRGDEAAFRQLYARHTPRLFQFVLRVVGGAEHDAEDVVQETWIRATQALGSFRWDAAFATWLTGIGLNVARGLLRREGRWDAPPNGLAEPQGMAVPHGERIDLERALALLPAGYRTVLLLHDVEGYTHEEIGERLGISPGTSKSQLFNARRTLRRLLEPAKEGSHEPA